MIKRVYIMFHFLMRIFCALVICALISCSRINGQAIQKNSVPCFSEDTMYFYEVITIDSTAGIGSILCFGLLKSDTQSSTIKDAINGYLTFRPEAGYHTYFDSTPYLFDSIISKYSKYLNNIVYFENESLMFTALRTGSVEIDSAAYNAIDLNKLTHQANSMDVRNYESRSKHMRFVVMRDFRVKYTRKEMPNWDLRVWNSHEMYLGYPVMKFYLYSAKGISTYYLRVSALNNSNKTTVILPIRIYD